ncbi:MAG: urease accessory protein UreE, partial [Stellaceae bacterium]
AATEPLFEITAASGLDLLRIAWHLGNRHLPVQIAGERLRIRPDGVMAEMVTGLGGRIVELDAPFDPEAGAYHEHG